MSDTSFGSIEAHAMKLLDRKRADGTYRTFRQLDHCRPFETARYPRFFDTNATPVLHMCLNDYLGLSQNRLAVEAAISVLNTVGVSTCASRNIGGTRKLHFDLERALANLHQVEDCLLYGSGNTANTDAISCLATLSDKVKFFSDEENHASLIDGMRGLLLGERKFVFKHNDTRDLAALCEKHLKAGDIPILVIETLYSMSGEFAPIETMVRWFKDMGGVVVLNEVHAVAVLGQAGAGLASQKKITEYVDLYIGSLSKGWGAFGGYVAGNQKMVDLCRQTGVRAIFTTSIPEHMCVAALTNLLHVRDSDRDSMTLLKRVDHLRSTLKRYGLPSGGDSGSHISPLIVGSENVCVRLHAELFSRGFYASPIRYPTVPRGKARLRVSLTPFHTEADVVDFVAAVRDCPSISEIS